MISSPRTIFAPAKINLYLLLTGRLPSSYHTLDSLVAFADIGDEITLAPADDFMLSVDGPFAAALNNHDNASNLIARAVFALAKAQERLPHFTVTLTKNLPVASGIGGGSSDAAAVLWELMQIWDIPQDWQGLHPLMLELGADVPVCFPAKPMQMHGLGEILKPAPPLPELDIVLVNPAVPCLTGDVFARHKQPFSDEVQLPERFDDAAHLIEFLKAQRNDLYPAAVRAVPVIADVMAALDRQQGAALTRMSGSGATCFTIFDNPAQAEHAARNIADSQPGWWVRAGTLNRVERY